MAPNEPAVAYLSTADIEAALRVLPEVGWIRLRKISHIFANLSTMNAEDLLQEACFRALDGTRRCPKNLDLFKFFSGTMRSIASDTLKSAKRHPELRLVSEPDDEEIVYDPPDELPSAEETIIRAQEATRIKQGILCLFEDDSVAQIMVEGIMEGMDGEELRALTELDKIAFASKRKLIRRRIEKAFPEGWTR